MMAGKTQQVQKTPVWTEARGQTQKGFTQEYGTDGHEVGKDKGPHQDTLSITSPHPTPPRSCPY